MGETFGLFSIIKNRLLRKKSNKSNKQNSFILSIMPYLFVPLFTYHKLYTVYTSYTFDRLNTYTHTAIQNLSSKNINKIIYWLIKLFPYIIKKKKKTTLYLLLFFHPKSFNTNTFYASPYYTHMIYIL